MINRRNFYRLLQVQPEAPVEVIRSSFRTLMRECKQHPDLGGGHHNAALLIEAYETLSDPKRRAAYDLKIRKPAAREAKPSASTQSAKTQTETPAPAPGSRRSYERTGRSVPVLYGTSSRHTSSGEMLDFSPQGMLLQCREKLAFGATIHVACPLLHAVARVSQCRETMTKGQYSIGLKFTSVKFESASGTFVHAVA